ncbi:biotin carboxyl carrier protein of acetyl-CoA carboxylase, chloroplastic [Coffea eugenioides]|uniref:biotin carboxyl carrier protein of acetyl-CoA carboxylase, chloroplastic n=1 Tax=Coffea eugenioides TaxID=49369 RepID=UPI000F60629A|nr:biotin carboxyl carrier protein of acetyl-CoA carboxylase, chloroplastic [Coffea eugenioides]
MATAFGTATASASAAAAAKNAPKSSPFLPQGHRHFHHSHSKVAFRLTPKPKLRFCSKSLQSTGNRSVVAKAQLNEVAVDGSSNATATSPAKSAEVKDVKSSNEPVASEESVSQFMTQVSDLVKLVDSRDIVELQLKQFDCELLIRKKEALPPPPSTAPIMMAPSHFAPPVAPAAPAPAPAAAPAPAPKTAPAASPAAQSPKSSHPPLKCPMAGIFYRSPAPGEPAFVKIGDKVKKGQVLCIIEAMKLMNEIEADQSGTIVEIVAEDGKSVSVGTALFVIEP